MTSFRATTVTMTVSDIIFINRNGLRWRDAPTDNGFIEAFNSKVRAECLNAQWFMSLADAREKLEDWRRHYNKDRPHSAIGYNVPIAMHYPDGVACPSS